MPIVGYSRASGFSPLQVGWTHAYWAEGAEFLATSPSEAGAVGTWPDEIGTADMVQADTNKQPKYYGSPASVGSKPALKGDGSDDFLLSPVITTNQPLSIVVVATASAATSTLFSGQNGSATLLRDAVQWRAYSGANASFGTADGNLHLHSVYFNSGLSAAEVDGSASSINPGVAGLNRLVLFSYTGTTAYNSGYVAFAGVASGDVRADPKWAAFKAWVTSHYAITVA